MGGPEMIAAQAAIQLAQGFAERGQLRSEARALDENARIEETQGAYDSVEALRASRMQQGEDVTGAAASGAGLTGSVSDILWQSAVERQYEAMSIHAEAGMRAKSLREQASQKRKAGDMAIFGGVLRAGAQAINTASSNSESARVRSATAGYRAQALGTIPVPQARNWSGPV